MLQPTNNKEENTSSGMPDTNTGLSRSGKPVLNATQSNLLDAPIPVPVHRQSYLKKLLSYGFLTVLCILLVIGYVNRLKISDWWRLRGYSPPAYVAQLADQVSMNAYTRHLFYLNRPRILNTVAAFRRYCPEDENTIVLGCYHPGQNGIFIYNVPDPTLAGVTEVTAAHEVLHAVYARLSSKERAYINGLLENYYKHDLHNQTVLAEIQLYQQTEPHDVLDEMNSTFGTEIMDLPKPLETYYSQFFTNRAAIVDYEQQYQGALTSRLNTITGDDKTLTTLQQTITTLESQLENQYNQLNNQRQQMNTLLGNGQTVSYNSEVDSYNAKVDAYNQGVSILQNDINSYNQLVTSRNQIAGQLTTLDKALDTRLTRQSTQ